MESRSHSFNEVGTLAAEASSNPVGAGPLYFSDHQSASCETFSAFQPDASAVIPHPSNNLGTITVPSTANQNGWATPESWESHRYLIEQLYQIKGESLPKVMRIMDSEYGFRATLVLNNQSFLRALLIFARKKMYKSRIKQWGLGKNIRESEARAIIRKNKQRADQGKRSEIRVRNQLQNLAHVFRYLQRKGISIEDIYAQQTAPPTPEAVKLFTPISSPILTPQVLASPERMFHCIQDYVKGSFESGTWIKTDPTYQCSSVKDKGNNSLSDIKGVYEDCSLAFSEHSKGLFDRAAQQLDVATARVKNIFIAEHPSSPQMLFNLIDYLSRRQKDWLLTAMFSSFSKQGKEILGSEHPLTGICEWLESIPESNFDDVMVRCMECMTDGFKSSLGPLHCSTLISRVNLISRETDDRNARIQKMQKLLDECRKTMRPDDVRILQIHKDIACQYYYMGHYYEAQTFLAKNIVWLELGSETVYNISCDLGMAAKCLYALGEVDSGIATLHQAIEVEMLTFDPQNSTARKWLFLLRDWYVEQGRWDYAAQVQQRTEELRPSIIQNDSTQSGRWSMKRIES